MSLLRTIIIGTCLLISITLTIGFKRASSEIYKQEKKVKEKKKEKKKKRLVNPDVVSALQSLGFKKQESSIAAQEAIEKLGDVETEKLIKEALKQI
ncbi:hypothetical protein ES703_98020 [subsurface metagenome]